MKFTLRDRVVVVTGAASGIGAALTAALAVRGARLALIDRDGAGLEAVATAAQATGTTVATFHLDVTDAGALAALPVAIKRELGTTAVLINNAGIGLAGAFDEVTAEQFERVMAVNFFATVNLTRLLLPQLREAPPGQIVNLSSLFGIVGMPGQVAYCSSKFAVRGFSEALREELVGSDIGVTVVHPGGVRTNIAKSSAVGPGVGVAARQAMAGAGEKYLRLEPSIVAARVVAAIVRRERRLLVGTDARLLTALQWLLPGSYGRLLPHRER